MDQFRFLVWTSGLALSEEKMMEIYEQLQKDVSIHRQKELEMTDRKIKLLIDIRERFTDKTFEFNWDSFSYLLSKF